MEPTLLAVPRGKTPPSAVAIHSGSSAGSATLSVNDWFTGEPTPFDAVRVIGYAPAVPVPGVPDRVADPPPSSTKVTPAGSVPDSLRAGAGNPETDTANEQGFRTTSVVAAALVKAGGCCTVRTNCWMPAGLTPLEATRVIG